MSLPRVLIPDHEIGPGQWVTPDNRTLHHLKDVLRLSAGDRVVVVDGDGTPFLAELRKGSKEMGLEIIGPATGDRAVKEGVPIVLVLALLKSDHTELAIRKTTEAGVSEIRVAVCDRSVPRPSRTGFGGKEDRYRRVALEASRQCGRASVPGVTTFLSLEEAVASLPTDMPRFMMHEAAGNRSLAGWLKRPDLPGVVLAVGPEGSFSEDEVTALKGSGFEPAGLGPRILRAETAAIAAVVVAQAILGDMGTC